jgi:dihydroflavonol-4-reductase
MKVLVTGGTGFVGSQLAAALVRRGDDVRVLRRADSSLVALDNLPVEHVTGDILDPRAVAKAVSGCDLVFHVAALSSYWRAQEALVYRINVDGTRVVMNACLQAAVPRVVFTSSVAAVGIPRNGLPADETMAFDAVSASLAYADSKHRAEREVLAAIERGLSAVIVNPAAVFGPGDHHLISGSMIVAFARQSLPVVPPGGLCVVDIDAVVQGHLAAAERGRTGERYILGGENLSFAQIVKTICEVVGQSSPRWTLPSWTLSPTAVAIDTINRLNLRSPVLSGDQARLSAYNIHFDSSKAVRELSYPLLPFRNAVERAYDWYRQHGYIKATQ